ncbi:nitroreductase family protein [Methylobacillus flagellatus]|nr:nitroreductase family protein [Methylobacillus flagellatus]
MKKYIIGFLPLSIKWLLRFCLRGPSLLRDFCYDAKRYIKWSSVISFEKDREKILAVITATYHNIEKGMSLPNPRPLFGRVVIGQLVGSVDNFHLNFGPDPQLDVPINVLARYCQFNRSLGQPDSQLEVIVDRLKKNNQSTLLRINDGGVILRSKAEVLDAISGVKEDFFLMRHSVRQFTKDPIEHSVIEKAVRIAQKSPAVCNRQSGKVRAILNPELIRSTLQIQGGARGFYEEVQALFCITVDLSNFNGAERYQGWIDGGMFAMSFIYGLHLQGLGSCALNWSKTRKQDIEMRNHLRIPENELIIMFVAAGYLRESFVVPQSYRKPLGEVLSYI